MASKSSNFGKETEGIERDKDMKNIIHLYTISECGKKCPMCCNKLYDIETIPVVSIKELRSADTVCLTGGL